MATIVYTMCEMAVREAGEGHQQVKEDLCRLTCSEHLPDARTVCGSLLHTAYMSTENSSTSTKNLAESLAKSIGAYHITFPIDAVVQAALKVFTFISGGRLPRYQCQGGTVVEDLALQNLQARLRMVMAYLCAQLLPWTRNRSSFLLVLGSANVDESLRGYMTKYDCSSADLNPIGGICKADLKKMLIWAANTYSIPSILDIAASKPTAELRPLPDGGEGMYSQLDEEDMGMTYEELSVYGKLRKIYRCGPVTMFINLLEMWTHLTPSTIASKVKLFFRYYSINRHKMTTLTPSYHAENYSPDDNRFDLRQFLYNILWPRQFRDIDRIAAERESSR